MAHNSIHDLAELISEMPGIGPRQARRIVQFLLRSKSDYKQRLTKQIAELSAHIDQCKQCFRYDEINNVKLCNICADGTRDHTMLMVLEKDVDIEGVEAIGIYKGYYFVLGSLIPLTQQRKAVIAPRTESLLARLQKDTDLEEIVMAFATTPEGDFTSKELKNFIAEKKPALKTSLLARGLSLGAEIEYADQETLRNAYLGRH